MNGRCTNKSCSFETQNNTGVTGMPSKRARPGTGKAAGAGARSPAKAANPRRASKVVTYNLYDMDNNEQDHAE